MLRKITCSFLCVFVFFTCKSMENYELRRSLSPIEESHLSKIRTLDAESLMLHFEKCILNPIPSFIKHALLQTVNHEKYRRIIQYVVAKVEPYVDCANTLQTLATGIPDVIGDDQKALADVFLLYEKLLRTDLKRTKEETHDYDFSMTFTKTQILVNLLEKFPMSFADDEQEHILVNKNISSIDSFKRMWKFYKKIILLACPLIIGRKTFELVDGDESSYEFDPIKKCCRITIESQPLLASAITGPLLRRDKFSEPHSYKAEKISYSTAIGTVHELHHHITSILDKNAIDQIVSAGDFSLLSAQLSNLKCDADYIAQLETIWSNTNDFRDITAVGFFINGVAFYDPFAEGAVVDFIRASHLDIEVSNVPIGFVEFIRHVNPNILNLKKGYEEKELKSWI